MSENSTEKQIESALPKVLLDTNVLKFSANLKERFVPVNREIKNWSGKVVGIVPTEIQIIDFNERINGDELRTEARLLQQVAEAAKDKKLRILLEAARSLLLIKRLVKSSKR